jgi:hypothetical protein
MKYIVVPVVVLLSLLCSKSIAADIYSHEDSVITLKPSDLLLESDSTYSKFQFSLLPFIGSKGKYSTAETVDYSFNLLGGYNRNIRKAEFAGFFNADLGNVRWFQYAGVGNFVAKDVSGFQLAGCINLVQGKLEGVQISGIGNHVKEESKGVQISGIYNLNQGISHTIQYAGILNQNNDTVYGVQFAGILNNNMHDGKVISFAGLINQQWGNLQGAQISGLSNVANKNMDGVQVAGFANISNGIHRGSQIAGFLNVANKISGSQIGVFNIADSITGIPVGLFSYANNGYHKLEISANETFYANAAFHTGVKAFHNIFSVGIRPDSSRYPVWYAGYGFGSSIALSKHVSLLLNISSAQISRGDITPKMNLLNKGFLGVDIQVAKKISITTGPELNAWFTNPQYKDYPTLFGEIQPNVFYHEQSKNKKFDAKMWIGWKFGVRFF